MLHPLHIVLWCFSLVSSFIAVPSLSLCYSLPSLSLKLFTSIFHCISLLTNSSLPKPALLSENLSHLQFTAVLPDPLQIHIKHPTEHTYCGFTHSLATPSTMQRRGQQQQEQAQTMTDMSFGPLVSFFILISFFFNTKYCFYSLLCEIEGSSNENRPKQCVCHCSGHR